MSEDFEAMLRILKPAISGGDFELPEKNDYTESLKKAKEQGVYYMALFGLENMGKLTDAERNELFSAAAKNIRRNAFIEKLILKLEEGGVRCTLLKGMTVARFYSEPDVRISADTDILIPKNDEKRVSDILKKWGFEVEGRSRNDHHFRAYHKIGGIIEFHILLYQQSANDIFFKNKIYYNEERLEIKSGIYAMGLTDGLFSIVTHFIKHFLKSGAGIRQISDIAVYMKQNEEFINKNRFDEIMKELNYSTLIGVIKGIAVKYWGMDFKDAITDGSKINALLSDIEDGGAFGNNDVEREKFFNIISEKMSDMNEKEFRKYKKNNLGEKMIDKIFLPKYRLCEQYPIAKKHKFLIPALQIWRWCRLIVQLTFGKRTPGNILYGDSSISKSDKARIEMLKEIDILH